MHVKKVRVNFLVYDSVFTLATIMRKIIVAEISKGILKAKYYSIIVDGTQDTSKLKSTVVLR